MRSIYFLGFFAVGTVAAMAVGCGDDTNNGTGGSTTSSSSSASSSSSSSGTGGSTGDGNDTFETAEEFPYGTEQEGFSLDPPGEDVDFYFFEGVAGQQVLIQTDAKPMGDEFNQTYPDVVVTLYDANENQIAQNDDPTPRFSNDAQLFTVLPADGRYYVRVAECNVVFPSGCADIALVTNLDYKLYAGDINPDILLNEAPGVDNQITYTGDGTAGYSLVVTQGGFTSDVETDRYLFTVPADVVADAGNRPVSLFSFFPSGPDGSGSSADIQLATITDLTAVPNVVVAQVNPEFGGDVMPPLTPGNNYQLDIQHVAGAAGTNPFYYTWHIVDATSNPVEAVGLNDTLLTAEAMTPDSQADGSVVYRIDADIAPVGVDTVDYFSFDAPAGLDTLGVFCDGQRTGSGLRDLTVEVLDGNGMPITGGAAQTETESTPIAFSEVPISGSQQTLALRVTAGLQDTVVTSTYYRCYAVVYAAAP